MIFLGYLAMALENSVILGHLELLYQKLVEETSRDMDVPEGCFNHSAT